MESHMHEVDYFTYCSTCKHILESMTEDPCDECLTVSINEDSKKPINWEERKEKKKQ